MKLFILRHADAEPPRNSDSARELTPRGHDQARAVGKYCVREGIRPEIILTSPFRRAAQTAEAVAQATGAPLQTEVFLTSGMSPPRALDALGAYASFKDVMIVGHQPDLGELIESLIGEEIAVGKASLTSVECARFAPGAGKLVFTRSVSEL